MTIEIAVLVTIQLTIEYDPAPPYRAGSPTTAPAELVARARRALARFSPPTA